MFGDVFGKHDDRDRSLSIGWPGLVQDVEVGNERLDDGSERGFDDDQRDARELPLPAPEHRLGLLGIDGHVHGPHVRGNGSGEGHGLDDRTIDAVDRNDGALLPMRTREYGVLADMELLGLALVLAADRQHQEHEARDQEQDDQRGRSLGGSHDHGDDRGEDATERVDGKASLPALGPLAEPVPDHAGLADREVDEHPDGVERNEEMRFAVEHDDEDRRNHAQRDDPVRVGESVAAQPELPRHVRIGRQDRQKAREGVEARVRGQEQEQGREGLEQVERDRAVAIHTPRDLADDGLLLRKVQVGNAEVHGEERDPDEQDAEEDGHCAECRSRILRFGRLERGYPGCDRLGARECHGARRESAQKEQDPDLLGDLAGLLRQRA